MCSFDETIIFFLVGNLIESIQSYLFLVADALQRMRSRQLVMFTSSHCHVKDGRLGTPLGPRTRSSSLIGGRSRRFSAPRGVRTIHMCYLRGLHVARAKYTTNLIPQATASRGGLGVYGKGWVPGERPPWAQLVSGQFNIHFMT